MVVVEQGSLKAVDGLSMLWILSSFRILEQPTQGRVERVRSLQIARTLSLQFNTQSIVVSAALLRPAGEG